MKKRYKILLPVIVFTICVVQTKATTQMISVANFQFTPSAGITINVGDTVVWTWLSGSHNTTSTNIPAGATSWVEPMNSGSPVFMYIPTVAGSYSFVCTFHGGMGGSFTVLPGSGISDLDGPQPGLNFNNPATAELKLNYHIPFAANATLEMYNLIGKHVYTYFSGTLTAGNYSVSADVASFPRGIYIIKLETPAGIVSKRVMLQ